MGQGGAREPVRFALLGPVRAWRAGSELDLGPPQQRLLLAVLLAGAGRPVSLDELVDVLWEDKPTATAVNVIHRYVGALRRVFEPELPARATGSWLIRHAATYHLDVTAESSDLLEFRDLVAQARGAASDEQAVGLFTTALRLWRGRCGQGILASSRARAIFAGIDHECLAVTAEVADIALTCGMASEVVPFLRQAATIDPLNEAVQARLMLALAAAGNQAAALRTYETVRERLADELGIDPGDELAAAFQQVLNQQAEPVALSHGPLVRPAQLPPDLPAFAGRRAELKHLLSLLPTDGSPARGLTMIALDGMPGAGKTTLAVHWAHQVASRFPDGQLYVNMRGFEPNGVALEPAEALRGFLDALGIHPDRMPATVDGQTGLYRSLLSDRRVLVLIDNARDVDQVRPLLPGAAGCHVIVTSRNRLTGLVAGEGAYPLTLDSLSAEDARETLARRLGPERVETEPDAVEEIIALCGRLPLALAIVAARAAANPHFPLAAITAKLKQGKGTLEGFRDGAALDVRSVFSWSYRILTPAAARLFRLLSLHTGTDTPTAAAANLAGLSRDETQDLLDELARMRFLTEREPGRFVAHDLIRAYAMELRDQYDSHDEQISAIGRLLDYYMQSAYEANLLMRPHQIPERPVPCGKATPETLPDNHAAMEWFEAERKVLADLVRTAPARGFASYSWSLAFLLQQYYHRRGLLHDWEETMSAALAIAVNADDKPGQAAMHRSVAGALYFLGRYREALVHLEQTEKLFDELGYTAEHAYVNSNFGTVLTSLGDYVEAIDRHRRALRLYEEMKDKKGQAISYEGIGECQGKLGNHDEAILLTTRAMSLYKGINELNGEGACWRTLGEVYHDMGAYDEAIRCFEPAARICRELVNRTEEVEVMISMGDTMYAAGMTDDAVAAWRSALALIEELRLPRAEEIHSRIAGAA